MANSWNAMPLPLFQGGEDSASAPLVSQEASRVENALITGQGVVAQIPDWRVAATCKDLSAVENDAVCGIFPFQVQGGASAASAGVAFSFDTSGNQILLHQLGEDDSILRALVAISSFTENKPPQMTGFEMFSKFYFCPDARESPMTTRKGLWVFDPAGAGTLTQISQDVGGGAAALRFKGIAKHRGATALGWGYFDASTPDRSEVVRFCKYGSPDTWVPDTDPTSAGWFQVGTRGLAVTAAAAAGQVTVIGKPSEVFVLDGDYSEQFYLRQIGTAHGPVSVTGMVSTGPMAVWMSEQGPAVSEQGGNVQLLATNRLTKRLSTYYDLTWTWAVHDSPRTRVGFLLRRATDMTGLALTANWADEILWWDYIRDTFTIQGTPTTCFSIGTTEGPQLTLAIPSGSPGSLTRTWTSTTATFNWTNADENSDIYLKIKESAGSTWATIGPIAPGSTTYTQIGLTPATGYDWQLLYYRNGTYGTPTNGTSFTTSVAASSAAPTNFVLVSNDRFTSKGVVYGTVTLSWDINESSTGAVTLIYEGTTSTFAAATVVDTLPIPTASWTATKVADSTNWYYWAVARNADGTLSSATALASNPIQYGLL